MSQTKMKMTSAMVLCFGFSHAAMWFHPSTTCAKEWSQIEVLSRRMQKLRSSTEKPGKCRSFSGTGIIQAPISCSIGVFSSVAVSRMRPA